jgi:hypothetical protein
MTGIRTLAAFLFLTSLSFAQNAAQDDGDDARARAWLVQWQQYITNEARNRYCDKENAEELAWLMGPLMEGFYYGWLATGDPQWVDKFVDWTDSWVKRGVEEPDGFIGWPKPKAAGTDVDHLNDFNADSLLGEAVVLRPVVLMSREILGTPALEQKYGAKARSYIKLAEQTYRKWDQRGVWRGTRDGGVITVVLPFGIDAGTGGWTDGYAGRNSPHTGFSHPDNKANLVARWLLAMSDVTNDPTYRERAEKWFRVMKSRMTVQANGTYQIWNYWQPAGEWDYKPDGSTKHWVGVHPNGGYYEIDAGAIADAFEHGVVFTKPDIERLIATALAGKRDWQGLIPYSPEIRNHFEASFRPGSWGGLKTAPWYLALRKTHKLASEDGPAL